MLYICISLSLSRFWGMGVGGFGCGFVCFVYTRLQLTFDKRQGFPLQERCVANDNADFVS